VETALYIAQIISAIVLVLIVLTQNRSGGLGSAFGGDSSSIYRTRRGIEKTLFNFAIGAAVAFLVISLASTLII
jgi:preprotein translocase subunit SecG